MSDLDAIHRLNAALDGRYRIERELGEGGMAMVYLADDVRHDRKVAVKVLKPELAAIVGSERFLAEIKTTAKLQHPHILPLFDSGEADGFLFYVMPYIEGESLRDRLEHDRQLPIEAATGIAGDLADALDHAHGRGIVHRDIKPANVLLLDDKAVISDFGIALAVGAAGDGRITETGLSLGTPHYMSPEQATGDRSVGPASDIYALGCVLYEMLVGEPPFTGSTPQAVLGRIVTGDSRPVSESRPTVPPNVESAIKKAIEKVPADRFTSGREFVRALEAPGFRWPPPTTTPAPPARGRARFDPVSVGVGAAVGIGAALLASWLVSPGRNQAPERIVHSSIVSPREETLSMSVQSFAVSNDGTRIVYRVSVDGVYELRTRLLSESEAIPIPGTRGAGSLFLSPDGEWVAFHHPGEGELRRVRVTGGPVERVASLSDDVGGQEFHGGVWGPQESMVIATGTGLWRLAANGGPVESLTVVDPDAPVRHRQPVVLSDGQDILYTVTGAGYPAPQELAVRSADGTTRTLTDGHSARVLDDGLLIFSRGEDGGLWAARLQRDPWTLRDEPVRVLNGASVNRGLTNLVARYDVAADGTLLFYPADAYGSWDIVWVGRAGETEVIVERSDPRLPPDGIGVHGIRLSPDGTRLAFTAIFDEAPGFRIFVYDFRRGTLNPVTVDENADWAVWTPDGERIVFNRFTEDVQDLFVGRVDNARPPGPLIPSNPYVQFAQAFSPDGGLLLVQQRASPNAPDRDLHVVRIEGGETMPYLDTTVPEYLGAVSPDGRWAAYTSEESGEPAVYVTEFPESRSRVRVSVGSAFDPLWNPVGDELFYRRSEDGVVMAVPYSDEGGFAVGTPEPLVTGDFRTCCMNGRSYDVSPDGDRFVMMRRFELEAGSGVPRLDLVRHWVDDVRRRLDG